MTVSVNPVATVAIAETPAQLICDVAHSAFETLDQRIAADLIGSMGSPACYQSGQSQVNLNVYVDQELDDIDGSMVTSAALAHYRITFLKSDIPAPKRGDRVITANGTFVLETLFREQDAIEWSYSASKVANA